jgi:hypothetical protein
MALRMSQYGKSLDPNVVLARDVFEYLKANSKNGKKSDFNDYVDANYDSSGDFWKLVIHEDGSHEFQWDGNLNIYDEDGNVLMGFKALQELIRNQPGSKNKTIELGGVTINMNELTYLQRFNNRLVQYGLKNPSSAATALLNDGKIDYNEAFLITGEIRNKGDFYVPNMIEHLSVRVTMNQLDAMIAAIGENISEWSSTPFETKTIEPFPNNSQGLTMELLPFFKSLYHGPGNQKWQSEDGNELVFRYDGQIEQRPEYIGTFNFGIKGIQHFFKDMLPYYWWGNSPDDLSNQGNIRTKYYGKVY